MYHKLCFFAFVFTDSEQFTLTPLFVPLLWLIKWKYIISHNIHNLLCWQVQTSFKIKNRALLNIYTKLQMYVVQKRPVVQLYYLIWDGNCSLHTWLVRRRESDKRVSIPRAEPALSTSKHCVVLQFSGNIHPWHHHQQDIHQWHDVIMIDLSFMNES